MLFFYFIPVLDKREIWVSYLSGGPEIRDDPQGAGWYVAESILKGTFLYFPSCIISDFSKYDVILFPFFILAIVVSKSLEAIKYPW